MKDFGEQMDQARHRAQDNKSNEAALARAQEQDEEARRALIIEKVQKPLVDLIRSDMQIAAVKFQELGISPHIRNFSGHWLLHGVVRHYEGERHVTTDRADRPLDLTPKREEQSITLLSTKGSLQIATFAKGAARIEDPRLVSEKKLDVMERDAVYSIREAADEDIAPFDELIPLAELHAQPPYLKLANAALGIAGQ